MTGIWKNDMATGLVGPSLVESTGIGWFAET
jgi:hypothetical protein